MSDIDDDLLALAGIGSDDDVQESEDDYEPEVKSKSSGTKRKIQESDDEEDDDDEGEKDPYPLEGKFKDAQDRDELMAMDEMTREQILFDRIQEMQKYRERKYLALRARQSRVENTLKDSTANKKKALRTNKLSELKKQREKKSKGASRRSRDESEDEDDEDDEDQDLMSVDEEDDYDEGYYSDEADNRATRASRRHAASTEDGIDYSKPATLSDINTRIRVGRSALAKFLYREEFPTVIPGTFARLNIGFSREQNRNQYRLCKVEEVKRDTSRPYTLSGKPCNYYLVVSQGASQKVTDLNCVSDSLITEDEFAIYRRRVEESDQSMPTIGDVDYKYRELKEMSTKKLTDEDINKMVQAREAVSAKTMESGNRVRKLQIAREELEVAISNNDMEEINRLQGVINELNKYTQKNKEESSLTKVNLRNRKTNDNLIRKAEKHAVEGRKQQSSSTNSDPFSRLRTSTKMFYSSNSQQSDGKITEEIKGNDLTAEEAIRAKAEAREKERKAMISSKYRKFGIDSVIKDIPFDIQIDI